MVGTPMAPPPVTIRPYVASDWPAICRIYDAAKPVELEAGGVAASFCPLDDDPDRKQDFELHVQPATLGKRPRT